MQKIDFFKRIAPLFLVVLMLCTMTVTAFAAEAEIPAGFTVLGNGEEFTHSEQIQSGVSGRISALIPVTEGVSYTFVPSDSSGTLARFCGVAADGTITQIGMCRDMEYTYTADGTYQWITIASINSTRVTGKLVWEEPTNIIENVGNVFTNAIGWVGTVANTVTNTPILLLFAVLCLVGLGVGIFKRLMSVN